MNTRFFFIINILILIKHLKTELRNSIKTLEERLTKKIENITQNN